jgi:hypothetical protein
MAHLALRAMTPGDNNFGAFLAHALHKVHKRKLKRRKAYALKKKAALAEKETALPQNSVLRNKPAMSKLADEDGESEKKAGRKSKFQARRRRVLRHAKDPAANFKRGNRREELRRTRERRDRGMARLEGLV